jgi:hypothetical protein
MSEALKELLGPARFATFVSILMQAGVEKMPKGAR